MRVGAILSAVAEKFLILKAYKQNNSPQSRMTADFEGLLLPWVSFEFYF